MSPGWSERSNGTTVEYGRALGTAVHTVGVADWLTLGFQAEGAKDLAMGGAGFNAAVAAGHVRRRGTGQPGPADKAHGYAATGVYSFLAHWFSGEMRATWIGPQFRNLFLDAGRPASR